MEVNGPGKTPQPNTSQAMTSSSDHTKNVGKQALDSTVQNMETTKKSHDMKILNKDGTPTKGIDNIRNTVLS